MKLSYNWLKEWVDTGLSPDALSALLTCLGLEVDEVGAVGDDHIIDIDLTPNRADCLGVLGIARDVAAVTQNKLNAVDITPVPASTKTTLPITLDAEKVCPRYAGRVIENINPSATTPDWMATRLTASGISLLHPVVDVANYVMITLGQPMHGFDVEKLNKQIIVRFAKDKETLTLLDDQAITLSKDLLVIADDKAPVALAGIMGGLDSSVTENTQHIFLESAFFQPSVIANRARRFGLHTDASHRFERGVDPQLCVQALEYATQLLLDIVGGDAGPVTIAEAQQHIPTQQAVAFRPARAIQLIGHEVAPSKMQSLLEALGCTLETDNDTWKVTPPSWRFDMAIEEDVIEEIARLVGYDNIPAKAPAFSTEILAQPQPAGFRGQLTDLGYTESIHFTFVNPDVQKVLFPEQETLSLSNPIAPELSEMRLGLLPGLLTGLVYNQHRQQTNIRLFEQGVCFMPAKDKLSQEQRVAAILYGDTSPLCWREKSRKADFYDIKGDLETLLTPFADIHFQAASRAFLHPGQSADVMQGESCIGWVGAVHPGCLQTLDIKGPVFAFEVFVDSLTRPKKSQYQAISKFPSVTRDLALVVDDSISAQSICLIIDRVLGKWLNDMEIFDVYQGSGMDPGQKSIALRVTLQASTQTLTDDEINPAIDALVSALQSELNATLRN